MTTPSKAIELVLSATGDVLPVLEAVDQADALRREAEDKRDAALEQEKIVAARLERSKAELSEVEDALRTKRHRLNAEAAQALEDTNNAIATGREALRAIEQKTQVKAREYERIMEALNELKGRL